MEKLFFSRFGNQLAALLRLNGEEDIDQVNINANGRVLRFLAWAFGRLSRRLTEANAGKEEDRRGARQSDAAREVLHLVKIMICGGKQMPRLVLYGTCNAAP